VALRAFVLLCLIAFGAPASAAPRFVRAIGSAARVVKDHAAEAHTPSGWTGELRADRPPVLLIHGMFSNAGIWRGVASALRKRGRTDIGFLRYRVSKQNKDEILAELHGLVEDAARRGHPRVSLVGHSLGGVVASLYAAEHPEHVAQIITLAAPVRPYDDAGLLSPKLAGYLRRVGRWAGVLRWAGRGALVDTARQMGDRYETGKVARLIDGELGVPMLSLIGKDDPLANAETARVRGPNARVVTVEGGHAGMTQQRETHQHVVDALEPR
jgi:pimeloyl-ACP methyl ester carboxylesterase